MAAGTVTTGALLAAIETRLGSALSGEEIPDFLGSVGDAGARRAHKGIRVFSTGAQYEQEGSRATFQWAVEQVVVETMYRVRPQDQIADRTASLTWRDLIVAALTSKVWMDSVQVLIRLDSTASEYTGEWLVHTITLAVTRRQSLG